MANTVSQDLSVIIHAPEVGVNTTHEAGILTPDLMMVVLTWVTFFLLLGILYKFAWQPILSALDAREERIRRSLDDARKAQEELEQIRLTKDAKISEADRQAQAIVDTARRAAIEGAKNTEHKAREDAKIILTNAQQEIRAQAEKASVALREESVTIAVGLAEKILQEELDAKKHQKLIDRLIKDFYPDEYKE